MLRSCKIYVESISCCPEWSFDKASLHWSSASKLNAGHASFYVLYSTKPICILIVGSCITYVTTFVNSMFYQTKNIHDRAAKLFSCLFLLSTTFPSSEVCYVGNSCGHEHPNLGGMDCTRAVCKNPMTSELGLGWFLYIN